MPTPERKPAAALEAVEAEVDAGDGTVEVPLGDTTVHVRPVGEWRSSAVRAMRGVLHGVG
jgi:trehalose-6-phosphatase